MAVSFRLYALLTAAAAAAAAWHAASTKRHFYPAAVFLTTSKVCVMVLANLGFCGAWAAGRAVKAAFLGPLDRNETHELVNNAKFAVTETCLALTLFRSELDMRVLALFTLLLFLKCFHWLAAMRVDKAGRDEGVPARAHLRLGVFVVLLKAVDALVVVALVRAMEQRPSVLLLFAFEHTLLGLTAGVTLGKLLLLIYDNRRPGRWAGKPVFLFALEFTNDLVRLLLSVAFFAVFCMYYGVPLHLIREIYFSYHNLFVRARKFYRYRQLTKNMNERFADVTEAELEAGDRTCIVCREDMHEAKRLPCGHYFHFHCLRTWFERSQTCPTCRRVVPTNVQGGRAAAAAAPAAAPAAAAPAPAAPAPAAAAPAPAPAAPAAAHHHHHHAAPVHAAAHPYTPLPAAAVYGTPPPEALAQMARAGTAAAFPRPEDALEFAQAHAAQLQNLIDYLEAQLLHTHGMLEQSLQYQERLHDEIDRQAAAAAAAAAVGDDDDDDGDDDDSDSDDDDGVIIDAAAAAARADDDEKEPARPDTPATPVAAPRPLASAETAAPPAERADDADDAVVAAAADDDTDEDEDASVWGAGASSGSEDGEDAGNADPRSPPFSRPGSRSSAADVGEIRRRRLERFNSRE